VERGRVDSGTPVWEVFQESKRDAGDSGEEMMKNV